MLCEPEWELEKVENWSKRIANYSEPQKAFYQRMIPKLDTLSKIKNSTDNWRSLVTDTKK